jgi:hypothetical protein
MAAPAIPSNFNAQTANRQNYLSWDITVGATSYSVQRSTDGVSYSVVESPTTPEYLDTDVTVGNQYWYKVAATNSDGTSSYTTAQSLVPVPAGDASLGQLRLAAKQRADRVNSNFVTKTEWDSYINQSLFELYDLLVTAYGEEYFATYTSFTTDGTSARYALPDGANHDGAEPFYKLLGVDLAISPSNNAYVSVKKFNFIDRNKYIYGNSNSALYGNANMQYRAVGNYLEFIPTPSANQTVRLWYIPRMTMLLRDTDITPAGVSGWWEYVIVDAAIKALQKEESDVGILAAQKLMLQKRIEAAAMNRDAGQADTISDTRGAFGPWGSGQGGWGGPTGVGW